MDKVSSLIMLYKLDDQNYIKIMSCTNGEKWISGYVLAVDGVEWMKRDLNNIAYEPIAGDYQYDNEINSKKDALQKCIDYLKWMIKQKYSINLENVRKLLQMAGDGVEQLYFF